MLLTPVSARVLFARPRLEQIDSRARASAAAVGALAGVVALSPTLRSPPRKGADGTWEGGAAARRASTCSLLGPNPAHPLLALLAGG